MKRTVVTIEVALELVHYVSEVWIERAGEHGGKLRYTFEKGDSFVAVYRLWSECKEAFMNFPKAKRLSMKAAFDKYCS